MTLYLHTTQGAQLLGFDRNTGWRVREGRECLKSSTHSRLSRLPLPWDVPAMWEKDAAAREGPMRDGIDGKFCNLTRQWAASSCSLPPKLPLKAAALH